MSPDRRFEDIAARMDTLLTAYLDSHSSFEETQAKLTLLWRELIPTLSSTAKRSPATGEETITIHADQFQNLMEGRTRDELDKGMEVLKASIFAAQGEPG